MGRNKYNIKKDQLYYLANLREIVKRVCKKQKLNCPNLENGLFNQKAREYGFKPDWNNGRPGQGYREKFLGGTCIAFIDRYIEELSKGQGKAQLATQTLPLLEMASDIPSEIDLSSLIIALDNEIKAREEVHSELLKVLKVITDVTR